MHYISPNQYRVLYIINAQNICSLKNKYNLGLWTLGNVSHKSCVYHLSYPAPLKKYRTELAYSLRVWEKSASAVVFTSSEDSKGGKKPFLGLGVNRDWGDNFGVPVQTL